ncbi:MAG: ATP-binding domain-containing protein [Armatimonadetes bacterium]|nr:ATP-binding domain-containing protein [Armatimonadota bacterium]
MTHLKSERSLDAQSRIENVEELVSVTEEFQKTSADHSLRTFLEQVALMSDLDTYEESGNAVTLMTLHSAKGLEFPIVFMVSLEEGMFPHSRSLDDYEELEEERRLCYVGMTRAKEELHLSHAHLRTLFGSTRRQQRSRFLDEVPDHLLTRQCATNREQLLRPAVATKRNPASSTFRPGQKVIHGEFGRGIVLSSTGLGDEEQVTIAFDSHGLKKLLVGFAKLDRV